LIFKDEDLHASVTNYL